MGRNTRFFRVILLDKIQAWKEFEVVANEVHKMADDYENSAREISE